MNVSETVIERKMKTSTRLIVLLTLAVCGVMASVSFYSLRQQADALEKAAHAEVRAHALTLQLALEEQFAAGRLDEVQQLINRIGEIGEKSGVFGVILFDRNASVQMVSQSLKDEHLTDSEAARQVIAGSPDIAIPRRLHGQNALSYVHPIIVKGERIGAMELTLTVDFVEKQIAQATRDTFRTLALLCVVILLVVSVVTRYSIMGPINELLSGADELARGNLSHRVQMQHSGGEFAKLAQSFNHMADSLNEQRQQAALDAEERVELERQLRHHERLAVVGQLAAGIAHELGAPLQVIDGRAKQLQDGASPEKQQRNLQIIRAQAERITRMVRNLLNLARPHRPLLRPLDLSKVVHTTLESLEPQIQQANVRLEHHNGSRIEAFADGELLQQVFLNICVNSLHAMPQGGVLQVTYEDHLDCQTALRPAVPLVGPTCLSRKPKPTPRDIGHYAVVRIFDTGSGISAEHIDKVFNLFFTTKEVGKGTGLGLPVSSRIIEEQDGWIEAGNWDNGTTSGAVFSVYLPKPSAPTKAALNSTNSPHATNSQDAGTRQEAFL